jgi:hypothetical protein
MVDGYICEVSEERGLFCVSCSVGMAVGGAAVMSGEMKSRTKADMGKDPVEENDVYICEVSEERGLFCVSCSVGMAVGGAAVMSGEMKSRTKADMGTDPVEENDVLDHGDHLEFIRASS